VNKTYSVHHITLQLLYKQLLLLLHPFNYFQDNLGKLAEQVEQLVVQQVNFYVLVITSQYVHRAPRIFSLVSET